MDNRYLYRAKSVVDNKWIVVYLKRQKEYDTDDNEIILTRVISLDDFRAFKDATDGNTVCQCTGRKDKNGKLIFEDDIVEFHYSILPDYKEIGNKNKGVVKFGEYQTSNGKRHLGFYIEWADKTIRETHRCDVLYWIDRGVEIIGNIHDNPELLDEEEGAKCND